jgi:hypothetical protein
VRKGSIGAHSNRPTVSVILPAWNAAGTIGRALDSALSARLAEVECVVVDDGSTDGTADIVAGRAATDSRVVLLREPTNSGPSAARNRGLDAARGEWLTFLDSDDVLLPGGLDALIRGAEVGATVAVVGQRVWTDGRSRWVTAAYDKPDIRLPGRKSLATSPGLLYYASATGKLFNRTVVNGLRFEGRVLGDQPWTIRALLRAGDRITVIRDAVYEWRRDTAAGSSSITAAKRDSARLAAEAARVAIRALAEVAEEAASQLPEPTARRDLVAAYFERLVRSDLAGPVRRAVTRADLGTDALFAAIEAFLAAAPHEVVAASESLAPAIVRPPLDHWLWLGGSAKRAYLRMLRSIVSAHPELPARWARPSPLRLAIRILLGSDGAPARLAADVLLAVRLPAVMLQRLRRARTDGRRAVSPGS